MYLPTVLTAQERLWEIGYLTEFPLFSTEFGVDSEHVMTIIAYVQHFECFRKFESIDFYALSLVSPSPTAFLQITVHQ